MGRVTGGDDGRDGGEAMLASSILGLGPLAMVAVAVINCSSSCCCCVVSDVLGVVQEIGAKTNIPWRTVRSFERNTGVQSMTICRKNFVGNFMIRWVGYQQFQKNVVNPKIYDRRLKNSSYS